MDALIMSRLYMWIAILLIAMGRAGYLIWRGAFWFPDRISARLRVKRELRRGRTGEP